MGATGHNRAICPNCGRSFNCDGGDACWCLKLEREFDYEAMILRTGSLDCVCPVCITGRADLADVDAEPPVNRNPPPRPRRTGRRRRRAERK